MTARGTATGRGISPGVLATAGLLANAAIWGLSFVLIRDALQATGAVSFIALRFVVGSVALGLPLLVYRGAGGALRRSGRLGTLTGLALLAGYLLQTYGLEHTPAARAGFLTGLSVVMVPALARLLRGEPLRRRAIAALPVAATGLALLTLGSSTGGAPSIGDLLVFGGAACFALQIVLLSGREQQAGGAREALALALALWQTAVVALGALALLPVDGGPRGDLPGAIAAIALGIFGTAAALAIQSAAQRYVSAARTAFVYTAEPLFAAFFAALLGSEPLHARTVLGGAAVVAAMLLGG